MAPEEGATHAVRRRVVLFPLPFQGHISPMLQLADVLHRRGHLAVTVLHTARNAPDPAARPDGFDFVPVPDGMPAAVAASDDPLEKILAMNAAMDTSGCVRDALASILLSATEEQQPVSCLIMDTALPAAQKAAAALGLPTVVLHTVSAASTRLYRSYAMLHDKGYLPAQEQELNRPVKELPPLRVSDLFDPSKHPDQESANKILDGNFRTTSNSAGVVINTFEALETPELAALRAELGSTGTSTKVFAIGPLHELSAIDAAASSLQEQDGSCISWLDTQAPGSVLYASLGSVIPVQKDEFAEVAWGLAGSGVPFLWVVRRGLVAGGGESDPDLPDGFERAVEGRGKVVRWAPQREALAHGAVGGFWTHSGWNSTLESVHEGVPMLCRPLFGDQPVNARYVGEAWKNGVLLMEGEKKLERGKIAQAIRAFMDPGEKGDEMRERAEELRRQSAACLEPGGGSTCRAVDELVDHILSL